MNLRSAGRGSHGFTLVELLVSMVVLILLLLVLVGITDATSKTWRTTTSKIAQFSEAQNAFETLTRRLSQATLNTYWDYDSPGQPTHYLRQSELRFVTTQASSLPGMTASPTQAVFFQAPLGYVADTSSYANLNALLNTCGYFVEFGDDSGFRPGFISPQVVPLRYRFRMMELIEPSDKLTLYNYTSGYSSPTATNNSLYNKNTWFTDPLGQKSPPVYVVAENIVALIILPKLSPLDQAAGKYSDASLSPYYAYNSALTNGSNADLNWKNQIPPLLQVTMVAVDEPSFNRYQGNATARPSPDPLFAKSPFTDALQYTTDLQELQTTLVAAKLNYRVFTTDVSIKSAKWSRAQTN